MEYYPALKRKEILTHATTWINHEKIMSMKEARHKRTNTVWFHLYEIPKTGKFIDTEIRIRCYEGLQIGGNQSYRLRGTEFPIINVIKATELHVRNG